MNELIDTQKMLYPHVSVDCVLLGFNEDKLCVLLTERKNAPQESAAFKLPGDLIYEDEDLDEAAYRVLTDATRLKRVRLKQFRCFGSPNRTKKRQDVQWLEQTSQLKIGRLITIAYLSLCKISKKTNLSLTGETARWFAVDKIPIDLPFDHHQIITESIQEMRNWIDSDPSIVFEFLPPKFTAFQFRRIYEVIYNQTLDVRNFHKKLSALSYVVLTDDREEDVSHRAARFYRFDRVKFKQQFSRINL
jgi:ADP-ribose pyrophosphatase YjhB (NUDIX family)